MSGEPVPPACDPMLKEADLLAHQLGGLVARLEARARTQGDVDARWVATGKTDLQKGLMCLRRALLGPNGF